MLSQQTATFWEEWTKAVGEGWNRFWFTPASSKPLSMIRIAMGLLLIVYFLSNTSDLLRWYGSEGLLPPETVRTLTSGGNLPQFRYSLLNLVSKPSEVDRQPRHPRRWLFGGGLVQPSRGSDHAGRAPQLHPSRADDQRAGRTDFRRGAVLLVHRSER